LRRRDWETLLYTALAIVSVFTALVLFVYWWLTGGLDL
jgi:hypothetical protein